MDYSKYFDLMDDNKINEDNELEYKKEEDCCDNKETKYDYANNFIVCVNCGKTSELNEEDNTKIDITIRNKKFKLSTKMSYSKKFYKLNNIQKWKENDYKEQTADRNYNEIRNTGDKIGLPNLVIEQACDLYKKKYIDDEVSSRDEIKRFVYLHCLYTVSVYYKVPFDLFKILKKYKKKKFEKIIEQFNTASSKFIKKSLLNENMETYKDRLLDKYDINVNIHEFIIMYNEMYELLKPLFKRTAKKSILTLTIYKIIEKSQKINKKQFIKNFPISETTLCKYLKKLK